MNARGEIPRLAKAWLLGLLAAVAVAAVMSEGAAASSGASLPDSDGHVPVYSVCYSGVRLPSLLQQQGRIKGRVNTN